MKKRFLIGALITVVGFTGCASTQEISQTTGQSLKQLNASSIVISKRKAPDFLATTAMNVQFGMIGVAQQVSAGNKRIKENNVEDPAGYIANELAAELGKSLGINTMTSSSSVTDSTKVNELSEQYKNADLLVDVQTIGWQSIYYNTDWNNYRVIYNSVFRLIDTKKKTVLLQSKCSKNQDNKENAPSYDQLFENNAAVLKSSLKAHADACISDFKAKMLNSES